MKQVVTGMLLLALLSQAAAGTFIPASHHQCSDQFTYCSVSIDRPHWADGWFNGTIYTGDESVGRTYGYLAIGRNPTVGRLEGDWEFFNNSGTVSARFFGPLVIGISSSTDGTQPIIGWLTQNNSHFAVQLPSFGANAPLSVRGKHYESFMPVPTGPYNIGSEIVHLIDASRAEEFTDNADDYREMMVQLWYPTNMTQGKRAEYMDPVTFNWLKHQSPIPLFMIPNRAYTFVGTHAYLNASCAQGSFPILIFSHGYDGVRAIYTSLIEDLVSHGFIVAAINHPYIAGVTVFPDGRTVELAPVPEDSEQQDDYYQTAFRAVSGDIRFTLDYLTIANDSHSHLNGHLDLHRVGVYGHSFGGGATVDVCASDPRFRAGATLDGFRVGEEQLDTPLLFMLAEGRTNGSDIQTLWDKLTGAAYLAEIKGSAHYSYTDVGILLSHLAPLLPRSALGFGNIDAKLLVRITNDFLRTFFDVHLNGAPVSSILAVAELYEDVLFVYK